MDENLIEIARTDTRAAMRKEYENNQMLIINAGIKRNSPRLDKESVFYAIARNEAIVHFLHLDPSLQKPDRLRNSIPISDEYRSLMKKVGATRYPLAIKRKAEVKLYQDYTHVDYRRNRHFLDEELPPKPKSLEFFSALGNITGYIIALVFEFWWVLIIVFFCIAWFVSSDDPDYSGSNTFGSGGIRGGNSAIKSVSDQPQIKDNSSQAGFGNKGTSGYDAPSSNEAQEKSENIAPAAASNKQPGSPQEEKREDYFTIGSTPNEVRKVMRVPTEVIHLPDGQLWSYGLDTVSFSEEEKVTAYKNVTGELKVWLGDRKKDARSFGLKSDVTIVLNSMGTPTSITNLFNRTLWGYELSTVTFNSANQVIAYNNVSQNLNVWMANRDPDAKLFGIGSSEYEVLQAMGTPTFVTDLFSGKLFGYDLSTVTFTIDKVSEYSNVSKNLKVK